MKKWKKGNKIYIIFVTFVSVLFVMCVWLFGDKIFFGTQENRMGTETDVTIYKTGESYLNKNFAHLVKDGALCISDCGAIADSTYDYGDLFRSAIHTCLETGAKLVLEETTYYCSPVEGEDFLFDCSESFSDGFVIEGNGATIINTDCYSGFFRFAESKDIAISGLNFDYFFVPWVQADVVSYDKDTNELALMTDSNHCIFDDTRYMENLADSFGILRDKNNPRLIDDEQLNYFRITSVKKLQERGYAVTVSAESLANGMKFNIGDKVTINNRRNSGYSIFDVRTCGNVALSDINVYAANGCLVLGQYMTGDVSLKNVNILYGENEERWITTNSDGVHMQAGSGKLLMDNCKFEGLGDDGVNLYQCATVITERVSNNTFIVDGSEWGTRVSQRKGDVLIFYNNHTGKVLGEAKVVESEAIEGAPATTKRKITVDRSIEGIVTGADRAFATHVYRKDVAFSGTEIRNCEFNNIRGRGLVLRANNCIVSESTFKDISNHAIFVGNWTYEGTFIEGLEITKNTIINCSYNHVEANSYRAGSIGVYMESYDQASQLANVAHRKIVISDNVIQDFHGRAIKLGNTRDATIENNTFIASQDYHTYHANETIFINESENVNIIGNTFTDAVDGMTGSITYEGSSASALYIKDNQFNMKRDNQVIKK